MLAFNQNVVVIVIKYNANININKCNANINKESCYFYNLAKFLHCVIIKSIPKAPSYIQNIFDLVKKLINIKIDSEHTLI